MIFIFLSLDVCRLNKSEGNKRQDSTQHRVTQITTGKMESMCHTGDELLNHFPEVSYVAESREEGTRDSAQHLIAPLLMKTQYILRFFLKSIQILTRETGGSHLGMASVE